MTPRTDRLKAALEGVSCAALAAELKVSRQAVWRWSKGTWPPLLTFMRLCERLGKRSDWFFEDKEEDGHAHRESEAARSQG
jgi:transcriptional regulator with XRE-family HTH domain